MRPARGCAVNWPAPRPFPPAWSGLVLAYVAAEAGAGRSPATLATRRGHVAHIARGMRCAPSRITGAGILAWFGGQSWSIEARRSYRSACDDDEVRAAMMCAGSHCDGARLPKWLYRNG